MSTLLNLGIILDSETKLMFSVTIFSDCTSVPIVTVDARSENDNRHDTTNLAIYEFGWLDINIQKILLTPNKVNIDYRQVQCSILPS